MRSARSRSGALGEHAGLLAEGGPDLSEQHCHALP